MPFVFTTHIKTSSPGDTSQQYSDKVDTALFQLASDLNTAGWSIEYRYPYLKVSTTVDMSGFTGFGSEPFFQVTPASGSGYSGDIPLVINAIPSGYVPSPGLFIFAVVGSTLKEDFHPYIVSAMQLIDPRLIPIGTDPNDPNPNTILMVNTGQSTFPDDGQLPQAIQVPSPAVGLNTEKLPSAATLGGYAARTVSNGSDNYTSIFIARSATGGLFPFPPNFWFTKNIQEQPWTYNTVEGTNRSSIIRIELTESDWVISAGPHHMALAQISNGLNGHIQSAALDLSINSSGITQGTFAVGAGVSGTAIGFRTKPNCYGISYFNINGSPLYINLSGIFALRIMCLYGPYSIGHQWENGLGQITEPWVGFSINTSLPAAIIGKLPDCIVVNKSFDATTSPVRQFDGRMYKAFTNNCLGDGNGPLGTLFFATNDALTNPDCP